MLDKLGNYNHRQICWHKRGKTQNFWNLFTYPYKNAPSPPPPPHNNVDKNWSHYGSALGHIELTYHDVTVFAIPEFKSLEVLEKNIFALILLSINPKTNPNPNPDPNIKKKT